VTGGVAPGAIRIPDHVVYREFEGEAIVLELESGTYFGLDEVGARVWRLIAEGTSRDDIVARLMTEYDVEEPRLRADLDGLLAELARRRLVELP
jgi:hypothetical protein